MKILSVKFHDSVKLHWSPRKKGDPKIDLKAVLTIHTEKLADHKGCSIRYDEKEMLLYVTHEKRPTEPIVVPFGNISYMKADIKGEASGKTTPVASRGPKKAKTS